MKDFLDVARGLLRNGEVKEAENAFSNVIDAVGKLNAVHSKAILDTANIESVYTAFEIGKLLGRLPGIEDEERIDGLTSAIRKVIGYTLEKTTKVPNDSRMNPFQAYWEFTNIMVSLIKVSRSFSVITFNYDLGLDYSLYRNGLLPDYCLSDVDLKGNSVTYLKLHGSLNFGKCSNLSCGRIVPYRQFQYTDRVTRDYSTIPVVSGFKNRACPECGETLESDPVIIPPTWNKTAYHGQIEQVWRRAAKEMRDAEHIFVLGYSLPDTDWFFNYLYGLGVEMETPVEGFYVYNPDQSVRAKFEGLLGPGVAGRFHHYSIRFEDAVRVAVPAELGIGVLTIPQILNIKIQL
jgi:hypothetical protein